MKLITLCANAETPNCQATDAEVEAKVCPAQQEAN